MYAEALRLMQEQKQDDDKEEEKEEGFGGMFLESLRSCPFPAYFFETPPASASTAPSR